MKIYFINSKVKNCGVYQYGLRIWDALKKTNLDIKYFEIQSKEEFLSLCIDKNNVSVIFFNWIEGGPGGPFGWLDANVLTEIKLLGIKTISILHTDKPTKMDLFISQDPLRSNLPRPLYNFDKTKPRPDNKILNIGSFGFAGHHKNFPKIVKTVNDQFDECVINLNITNAHYGDQDSSCLNQVVKNIRDIELKPGIQLNITNDFLSNEDLLEFVHKNDLIVFTYSQLQDISSVVDYVISTATPIAVTNIGAFKHIYREEIDIEKYSLKDILNYNLNTNFIHDLRDKWSQDNLRIFLEKYIAYTRSYSQVCQDLFVYSLIGTDGFFLDIGAGWDDSSINSNTYLLEELYRWNGICIDSNEKHLSNRKNVSVRSKNICCKIPDTSIKDILDNNNAPKIIDYVSLDIDPYSIIGLQNFPFDEYEFKVLTFEHDLYVNGPDQKHDGYKILQSHGYVRLCENIRVPDSMGEGKYFEDWWINPKYFSENFIQHNTFKNERGIDIFVKLNNNGNNR